MLDHSITDHMAPNDLHGTLDLISKDFRVVTYLLQSSDRLSTSI